MVKSIAAEAVRVRRRSIGQRLVDGPVLVMMGGRDLTDSTTISRDGWTFKAAAGWVIREGGRRGDDEVVRQQL